MLGLLAVVVFTVAVVSIIFRKAVIAILMFELINAILFFTSWYHNIQYL